MADPVSVGIVLAIGATIAAAEISSRKKAAAKRRVQERRNNPCVRKGDGYGTQNNSEWLRLGSGPVKR
ncbi:MAG: hypothetical protein ABIH67_05245 [Candidatus Uhrbacteria bacterium]